MIIIKGRARTDGADLGRYLLNQGDNDSTTLIDMAGMAGRSLPHALALAEEAANQTRGTRPFWHAQINPAEGVNLTREQMLMAVDVLGRHLGLQDQPRVVVAHEKDGREHLHVVWSRYDSATGKLIRDDFTHHKNINAAAEIAHRLGLVPNQNPFLDQHQERADRAREDRRQDSCAKDTQAEQQQDRRAHKQRAERKAEISALWHDTATGEALRSALDAAGYTLARGQRGIVVIDSCGEVHSLARQIDGVRAGDVRTRLSDVDPGTIPLAEDIKSAMRQAQTDRLREQAQAQIDQVAVRPSKASSAPSPSAWNVGQPQAAGWTSESPGSVPGTDTAAHRGTKPKTAEEVLAALTRHHSTFTRQDLARAVDKETGGGGHEPWMMKSGGLEALDEYARASAERSYAAWANDNPDLASRFGIVRYVAYVQGRQAERDALTPEAAQVRKDSQAAFDRLMAEVGALPDLVRLGPDQQGRERFTSRDMLETELRLQGAVESLAGRNGHAVPDRIRDAVPGLDQLGDQQKAAFEHILASGDVSAVVGFAGTGKSRMLGDVAQALEAAGYRVRGAAFSGIAAESLQDGANIRSRTLHSLLHQLGSVENREAEIRAVDQQLDALREADGPLHGHARANQRERATLAEKRASLAADLDAVRLTGRDVVVLDEAGMVDSRNMERLLSEVQKAGAKVVLVGDHEQLQAVEAGAAFRAIVDRIGAAQLSEVRRQKEEWQRDATREFGETRTGDALRRYRDAGMTHQAETRDQAKADLVAAWTGARQESATTTQIILAYTRKDVRELNDLARDAYRAEGRLGADVILETETGKQAFADGDRLYFTKNDRRLGVRNGSLGSVEAIEGDNIKVKLDSGRTVAFDVNDYAHVTHGYAATVHKSQGVTVDRAHVLASRYMDRHAAYVGLSRHRDRADLYFGADEFKTWDKVEACLSRDGAKDSTLDYQARAQAQGQASDSLRVAVSDFYARHRPDTDAPAWTRQPEPSPAPDMPPVKERQAAPVDPVDQAGPTADRPMTRAERLAEIARLRQQAQQPARDQAAADRAEALQNRLSQDQRERLDEIRRQKEAADELRRILKRDLGQRGPSL